MLSEKSNRLVEKNNRSEQFKVMKPINYFYFYFYIFLLFYLSCIFFSIFFNQTPLFLFYFSCNKDLTFFHSIYRFYFYMKNINFLIN